jgi:hypothetical protein
MWTPAALASEARSYAGPVWRVVEDQHRAATMRLTDSLREQKILENLLQESKPVLPEACAHLHALLAAPFRYRPYPEGSRFRRADQEDGVFYASEHLETAVAEAAFLLILFFAESPGTTLPDRATGRTAFRTAVAAELAIDLTKPPLSRDQVTWTDPADYAPCQQLADAARAGGIEAIRYQSVRDPDRRANIALLDCAAFAADQPEARQSWRFQIGRGGVRAWCGEEGLALEFPVE